MRLHALLSIAQIDAGESPCLCITFGHIIEGGVRGVKAAACACSSFAV